MSHYVVIGFGKRFRNIEDAEIFRLDQVKKTGRTDLRIRKVLVSKPGQQILAATSTPSSFSSRQRRSTSQNGEGIITRLKRLIRG